MQTFWHLFAVKKRAESPLLADYQPVEFLEIVIATCNTSGGGRVTSARRQCLSKISSRLAARHILQDPESVHIVH